MRASAAMRRTQRACAPLRQRLLPIRASLRTSTQLRQEHAIKVSRQKAHFHTSAYFHHIKHALMHTNTHARVPARLRQRHAVTSHQEPALPVPPGHGICPAITDTKACAHARPVAAVPRGHLHQLANPHADTNSCVQAHLAAARARSCTQSRNSTARPTWSPNLPGQHRP